MPQCVNGENENTRVMIICCDILYTVYLGNSNFVRKMEKSFSSQNYDSVCPIVSSCPLRQRKWQAVVVTKRETLQMSPRTAQVEPEKSTAAFS